MTAATAPSPSPAPSAPHPHPSTPSRQSSSDGSTRRHDASNSSSPAKVTSSSTSANATASNLGTLAKPIDLASPPASPKLAATNASTSIAAESSRSSHQPSPSSFATSSSPAPTASGNTGSATAPSHANEATSSTASSIAGKAPAYANALATPNRLLPPTPLSNAAADRGASTSTSAAGSNASKPVLLPTPYKAPRLAQTGASESFATAYPTQETRQKYASPAKPLPSATGTPLSHKRSWQSSGSVDLSNKKFRPTGAAVSSPATTSIPLAATTASSITRPASASVGINRAGVTASSLPRPLSAAPAIGDAANTSSGITVTNIPKPGSALSKQAGAAPIDLTPAVSGKELPAATRDEYLSLLQKSELIDLVKQLETQLLDLIAAPAGSSRLYGQARIYPNQIHTQIDRLKSRQTIDASRPVSASEWSLKDIYSLLNSSVSTSNASTFARTTGALPRPVTVRPAVPSSTLPRRPLTSTAAPSTTMRVGTVAGQKGAAADPTQNASLNSIINSINAMVRQQAQPARGPNGAPLPPAQKPAPSAATRAASALSGKARPTSGTAPTISPATLRSIVGDGPMPSNAALAAAIAAHFGGKLPANAAAAARITPSVTAPQASTTSSQLAAANRAPATGPSKDISDKIAAILGSTSSSKPTMLGPQGLPLAPAATASNGPSSLPIGNVAAMLSSFAGQGNTSTTAGSSATRLAAPAPPDQASALSSLLQQFEEAKKRLPAASTSTARASSGSDAPAVQDPIAILTGASANPVFTPTYSAATSAATSPLMGNRATSWSPDPEPVIVQGPLGTSTLPSYEDMIVEGLRVMGEAPPRMLFNWMQDTYPLMKKFRPSAHQALQKAFKRGRLLKTGSMYRINPNWSEPGDSRKPTRRPQVGRDHPMVTPGLNGEVLAVSPLKDSQAYRNVGDAGLRGMKGARLGPRPYGQPGAAPLANPASSIFQNGSAASIILEYQKRTGKKLDADSVKQLYPLIRSGPSDGPAEEMLAHLLTQTGYHDEAATARAAAAAQTAAAAMSATMPSYAQPTTALPQVGAGSSVPSTMRTGGAAQSRSQLIPVAKGPTSLPLPTTSEPTMMQQLASMLNDLSSPINPVLANSLLGQLSSNAAAAAAARAANMPGMSTGPQLPAAPARTTMPQAPSAATTASSQLASALSSLARQPQQDLDSAVSETLAAALQQIGAAPTASSGPAPEQVKDTPTTKPTEAVEERAAADEVPAAGESGDAEQGINLAEYEDAIRALTSAFGSSGENADNDESDESDVEAGERAIAAAEAEPDSVIEESAADSPSRRGDEGEAQTGEATHEQQRRDEADEGEEEEDEEAEEDAEQMDLSAVLRQLTASLQAHQEGEATAQNEESQGQEEGSQETGPRNNEAPDTLDKMDIDPASGGEPTDAAVETGEAEKTQQAEAAQETHEADQGAEEGGDAASLQAQLEALVASLAANAGNANDDDDDEEEEEDDDEDDEEGEE